MGMGVVDTIMVGPLGPTAIAAAGVGNSLHIGFAIFGMGLLLGLDTLVSQAYGARDLGLCRRWLWRGLELAALASAPLMLMLLAMQFALPRLGFNEETLPLLNDYFGVVIWSTIPLLGYAAFRRYLQSTHHVTPVMFALVSANLVNMVVNWVLIFGHLGMPALGVAGAAWATVISRIYMCAVLAAAVWWSWRAPVDATPAEPLESPLPAPETLGAPVSLRRLVHLGFPAACTVTAEVGVFALATAMAGSLAPVATAAHQIALNIAAVAFMIPLGLASAGAVRVGNAVGARAPIAAAEAGWTVILLGTAFMLLSGLSFLTIPHVLIGAFTSEPSVLEVARRLLAIAAVFQLFDGLQGVITGTLRGLGDTRTPMITNLTAHWLIGLPVGYALCFSLGWGASGLWWGLSAGLIIAGLVLLTVWTRKIRAYQESGRLDGLRTEPTSRSA